MNHFYSYYQYYYSTYYFLQQLQYPININYPYQHYHLIDHYSSIQISLFFYFMIDLNYYLHYYHLYCSYYSNLLNTYILILLTVSLMSFLISLLLLVIFSFMELQMMKMVLMIYVLINFNVSLQDLFGFCCYKETAFIELLHQKLSQVCILMGFPFYFIVYYIKRSNIISKQE